MAGGDMSRRAARYAHAEGHTDVIYAPDGSELLTCGSDGDVRVWTDLEDDDPRSVCVGEWALSIALQGEKLYVSTDNHAIQMYTYPTFDKDGIVTRFTAPITHISASNKLSGVACCSENMESKICAHDGNKWSTNTMTHQGPVLGIAICPLAKYGMTSCGDGNFRIWKLDDFSIIKEIPGVPKVNSFYSAKVLGRASFEPITGKVLAYPMNKEVILLDVRNWQQKFTLTQSQIKAPLSICLFSPCGNYLAASNTVGQIAIWNINENKFLGLTEHPSSLNVSSMAWNPSGNGELAFCDVSGQLATVINCFKNKSNKPEDDDENLDLIDIIEREKEDGDTNSEFQQDSDGDDDENTISLRKLKKETLGAPQEGEDNKIIEVRSRSHSRSRSRSRSRDRQPECVPAQQPFQPSSTPLHLDHRYMCWNDVGVVRCHTTEDGSNIEVEFHDTSVHHTIHLNNHLNHTLASLSTSVVVLACEAPSKIVCIALVGGSKEWSVALGDIEEVLCVTATDSLVVAATSTRLLRLYTTLGTQLHVLSLLGPPVCLSGRGGILEIYYHAADPGLHDQHLAMDIIHAKGTALNCRRTGINVALSGGAQLRWCGSTNRGSPVTLDSAGMLRFYDMSSNIWVPICDTVSHYKGVSDSYFIISVNELKQYVTAVLCRGTHYPPTAPRPIATHLPLRLPLCEMETEKGQHEEQLRRSSLLSPSEDTRSRNEIVLKLFALACRSEIEQRAAEIIELLHDEQLAVLAARYATRLGKLHLAEKLSNLADSWKDDVVEIENEQSIQFNQTNDITQMETEDMNDSIILPIVKKQKEIAPLKPMPMMKLSQGNRNPFRVSNSDQTTSKNGTSSPLSLTDRTLVKEQNDSVPNTPKTILHPNPSETFPQWYERNKEALQAEHDDLTPSELTKIGIRTFKSLRLQTNSEITQKRKHSPEPADVPDENKSPLVIPKQSKLSAFAFQKRN